MLQRTRAEQVVPVYNLFVRRFPKPQDLASAGVRRIAGLIRPLGLRWRAKFLAALGRELAKRGGAVPDTPEELLQLPGVGAYAAAAYLSLHARRHAAIVDANVVRLYGRLFGLPTDAETRRDRSFVALAELMTPKRGFRQFNYALLDFSRAVCRPRPLCQQCPLRSRCAYGQRLSRLRS